MQSDENDYKRLIKCVFKDEGIVGLFCKQSILLCLLWLIPTIRLDSVMSHSLSHSHRQSHFGNVNKLCLVFLGYCGRLWSVYSVSTSGLAFEKSAGPLSLPMVSPTSAVWERVCVLEKDREVLLRTSMQVLTPWLFFSLCCNSLFRHKVKEETTA